MSTVLQRRSAAEAVTCRSAAPRKRVVILGGGFGGIYATRWLERTLATRPDVEVVLISRENYLLFTPKLRVAIKWSFELLFPREIEQLVTLRDVERMETLAATLRAMRSAADPVSGTASLTTQDEHVSSGRGGPLDRSEPPAKRPQPSELLATPARRST